MDAARKRVSLTVDLELFSALEKLSKKKNKTLADVSLGLIEKAISLEEDLYFSRIGDERLSKKEKRIDHKDAWN